MSAPALSPSEQRAQEDEDTLLGAVLRNGRRGFDAAVATGLTAKHFTHELRSEVWDLMDQMVRHGGQPSSLAVARRLAERHGNAVLRNWHHWMSEYAFTTVDDAVWFGKRVLANHLRRVATLEATKTLAEIADPEADVVGKVTKLSGDLLDLTAAQGVEFIDAGEATTRAITSLDAATRGEVIGVPTGYADLDEKLNALQPGRLYVLAARPSMGKSALAGCIAYNAARRGVTVPFFSLEMTAEEIMLRLACGIRGIDLMAAQRGRLSPSSLSDLTGALTELRTLPLLITERLGITPAEMLALARPKLRRVPRDKRLVIVDHLGIAGVPDEIEALGATQRTGYVSRHLKRMAKELDAPVLALAQLNRANEQREDKRPQLPDLRWAGEIEQDADCVMFVHRESYYLDRSEPQRRPNDTDEALMIRRRSWQDACDEARGRAEIIIAKQRMGPLGSPVLHFQDNTTWFSNMATEQGDE